MSLLDWIATAFLLGGAVLALLGSVGLLRFPDVLSRMHAAAKVSTVGVIAVTVAASLEAGAVAGTLVLVLVVVLLFLSGPLGMTLLARAAYHDPETPHQLTGLVKAQVAQPASRPVALPEARTSFFLFLGLLGAWVALFGSLRPHVLLGGLFVSAAIAFAFRGLAPRVPRPLLHPIAAVKFVAYFLFELSRSTLGVIRALWVETADLRPTVVALPLAVRSRSEITLLMNSISFTPGTVALELDERTLYVHVLTTDDPGAVARDVREMERRIMRMFGARTATS